MKILHRIRVNDYQGHSHIYSSLTVLCHSIHMWKFRDYYSRLFKFYVLFPVLVNSRSFREKCSSSVMSRQKFIYSVGKTILCPSHEFKVKLGKKIMFFCFKFEKVTEISDFIFLKISAIFIVFNISTSMP